MANDQSLARSIAEAARLTFPGTPDLVYLSSEQTCKRPAYSMEVNGKRPVACMAAH